MGLINISVNPNLSDSFGVHRGSFLMLNAENKTKISPCDITNSRFLRFSRIISLFE